MLTEKYKTFSEMIFAGRQQCGNQQVYKKNVKQARSWLSHIQFMTSFMFSMQICNKFCSRTLNLG